MTSELKNTLSKIYLPSNNDSEDLLLYSSQSYLPELVFPDNKVHWRRDWSWRDGGANKESRDLELELKRSEKNRLLLLLEVERLQKQNKLLELRLSVNQSSDED